MTPLLSLAVSQNFHNVIDELRPIVGALVAHDPATFPDLDLPKTVHLDGLVDDSFERVFTPAFYDAAARHRVELISIDCGPSAERVRVDGFYKPESPTLSPDAIVGRAKERLQEIRRRYKGPVSLENLDYHPGGAYEHVCEPGFIRRMAEELDAGLTLDIGHLNVTCFQSGMAPKAFLDALPMDRCVEVHLSHSVGGDDSHHVPEASDYALLDEVLRRGSPRYAAVEFYWDPAVIIREYRRLRGFLAERGAPARA